MCHSSLSSHKLEGTSSCNGHDDLVVRDVDFPWLVPPLMGQHARAKKAVRFVTLREQKREVLNYSLFILLAHGSRISYRNRTCRSVPQQFSPLFTPVVQHLSSTPPHWVLSVSKLFKHFQALEWPLSISSRPSRTLAGQVLLLRWRSCQWKIRLFLVLVATILLHTLATPWQLWAYIRSSTW